MKRTGRRVRVTNVNINWQREEEVVRLPNRDWFLSDTKSFGAPVGLLAARDVRHRGR